MRNLILAALLLLSLIALSHARSYNDGSMENEGKDDMDYYDEQVRDEKENDQLNLEKEQDGRESEEPERKDASYGRRRAYYRRRYYRRRYPYYRRRYNYYGK